MSRLYVWFIAGMLTALTLVNIDHMLPLESIRFMFAVDTEEPYDLVIGVLSARDHFRQRQAIRETWLKDINNITDMRIKLWFVLGDSPCPFHPADRVDPYSCEEWKVHDTGDDEFRASKDRKYSEVYDPAYNHGIPRTSKPYLDFKVRQPIVLKELGMLYWLPEFDVEVDVTLEDLNTQVHKKIFWVKANCGVSCSHCTILTSPGMHPVTCFVLH